MLVKLRNKKTGEEIERHSVDARELVESGEWALAEDAEAQARDEGGKGKKKKGKPAPNPERDAREKELDDLPAAEVREIAVALGAEPNNKAEAIEAILSAEFPA
jgi:hypothetical protein